MRIHHVCVIGSNYEKSINFYVKKLGLKVYRESYSANRNMKKIQLWDEENYVIELFINDSLKSSSKTRDNFLMGFEHIAFEVDNPKRELMRLKEDGIVVVGPQRDMLTGKLYGFCYDPDGQKIEFYEK